MEETKQPKKLRTFEAEIEEYNKFKSTLAIDGKDVGETINEFIRKFNAEFGDGNPGFQLDQWFDNDKMLAIPATMRDRPDWIEWVMACNDEEMLKSIMGQGTMITSVTDKRILELRGHSVKY